jgi:hypothetical protein
MHNIGDLMEEKDYKKMYLQERFNALQIEMNMINMRATTILEELPKIEKQLKEYADKDKKSDTVKA